ncbi:unnamed protein product [Albugo candida]|uniref:Uncharacterized protein n=1 Tax=Albugo candida TaxID=65357 RepID=A0A024GH38_9STRA|nr:unnamed protein product [Albugo candida]|eukprot:CCI46203.1 unnamed protein product [Albugo candida]
MTRNAIALRPILQKLIPVCFVTGAAIELFMVKTGFYEIVTNAEAERRLQFERMRANDIAKRK